MQNQMYPTDLSDHQWNCIKPLIPLAKAGGRLRSLDMRQVLNAMLYLVVTGCQWRQLPTEYPRWQSVYAYFRRWRDDGTLRRIHDTLRAMLREREKRHKHPSVGALDSQSVKSSALPGRRGYDAAKKVVGRKRHVLVDTFGLILSVVVTEASTSDPQGARQVLRRMGGAGKRLRRIWVDGTYRGQLVRWVALHFGIVLQAVLRPKRQRSFVALPHRWIVERTFAWLTQCRRLSREYEVLTSSSEAMIYLAMTRLMLRRLARP